MKTLQFTINISATPQQVWFVLWNPLSYRRWTSAFHEGSYAVSDWQQGSRVHFLSPEGRGMYANIRSMEPLKFMEFHHLGEIINFEEQPGGNDWKDAIEAYRLEETSNGTRLHVSVDTVEEHAGSFSEMFPKALALVKQLAEDFRIIVSAEVKAPIAKVWTCWTQPQHITQWNQASADWHTPRAENDLRPGGSFSSRMESKDGSMGFDFTGTYDTVEPHRLIEYHLADGRRVRISFEEKNGATVVTESFDPESVHSYDLQYAGWQAILDNFKSYTEGI